MWLIYNLKKLIIISLVFTFLFSCSSNSIQKPKIELPKGWYLSPRNSKLYVVQAKEKKFGYNLLIDRKITKKEDEYYIRIAEAIFPNQEIIKAYVPTLFKEGEASSQRKSWYFERLWWIEEFQGKLIPYTINSDVISKYIEYYKTFKRDLKKKKRESNLYGDNRIRVDFKYTVEVEKVVYLAGIESVRPKDGWREDQYLSSAKEKKRKKEELKEKKKKELEKKKEDKENNRKPKTDFVVKMKFHWFQYCGWPCGWGFTMSRRIVFETPQKVKSITGDGEIKKWASSIDDPYGLEWYHF